MATYTVNSTEDVAGTGPGILTLRQALALADANTTADTITFAAGVTNIDLNQGQLTTNSDVTIDGGAGVTISAAQGSRVLLVQGNEVTLDSLTITGGVVDDAGAGIQAIQDATLTLINSTVTQNIIQGDTPLGGGILRTVGDADRQHGQPQQMRQLPTPGGRLRNLGQSVTLINSTVSGNYVYGLVGDNKGGGIFGTSVTLTNSTVSGNHVDNTRSGLRSPP